MAGEHDESSIMNGDGLAGGGMRWVMGHLLLSLLASFTLLIS